MLRGFQCPLSLIVDEEIPEPARRSLLYELGYLDDTSQPLFLSFRLNQSRYYHKIGCSEGDLGNSDSGVAFRERFEVCGVGFETRVYVGLAGAKPRST